MVIYKAFDSTNFVQQLLSYFSLEEVKGKDKFHFWRYTMFKVHGIIIFFVKLNFNMYICSTYLGIMALGSCPTLDLM